MAMQFFNFGNDETYHVFRWVTNTGLSTELVGRAFAEISPKEIGDDESPSAQEDVCYVARDKLAAMLEDQLEELIPSQLHPEMCNGIGEVTPDPSSLWQPLAAMAWSRVDFVAVAVAILIQAGKWNPGSED